jgi:hypothetical protein
LTTAARTATTATYSGGDHGGAGTTTLVINVPAGVQDGDLLVCAVLVGTATTTTITIAGWEDEGQSLGAGAHPMFLFNRIASSEPASYTITLASARICIAAVMGAWDKTYLDPDPIVIAASSNKDDDKSYDLVTNTRSQALGIMALGRINANNRGGQNVLAAPGWTQLVETFVYSQAAAGAGELAFESHLALEEVYDDNDFAGGNFTSDGGDPGGVCGWMQYFFDVGYYSAPLDDEGNGYPYDRRHATAHALPYYLDTGLLDRNGLKGAGGFGG